MAAPGPPVAPPLPAGLPIPPPPPPIQPPPPLTLPPGLPPGPVRNLANATIQLTIAQAYFQDKFHLYRNGLPGAGVTLAAIDEGNKNGDPASVARWADIVRRTTTLPQAGNYRFSLFYQRRLRNIAAARRVSYRGWNPQPIPRPDEATQEAAKDQLNNFRNLLRTTLLFDKCIGWGRDGIITLWRYKPSRGRQDYRVVMKQSASGFQKEGFRPELNVEGIIHEKDMMTMLCGAPHTVQRFLMTEYPAGGTAIPGSRRSARVAAMATKVDDVDGNYILMEYCRFNNLASHLMRAAVDMPPNGTERWLPESVLWRIFDCLVKGCMAMQCPPRYVPGNVNLAPAPPPGAPPLAVPLPANGVLFPEVIAPGAGNAAGHMGLVHLDLDPTNVFIRDFDAPALGLVPGHTTIPRIQIGDFGATKKEDEVWSVSGRAQLAPLERAMERRERWNQRLAGKLGFSLPEQFGKDWDLVPIGLDPSDAGAQTPGMAAWGPPPPITTGPARYTSASNVWHMGMVMKVCMTLCNPDSPPYAGRMTTQEPAPPQGGTVPAGQQRWTYGWSLLDPAEPWLGRYQRPLIDLVARCLMARQEFRPTLQQVQAIVTQELANPANANVPPYWTNTFFAQPRLPAPPRAAANVSEVDPFWDYRTHKPIPTRRRRRQ